MISKRAAGWLAEEYGLMEGMKLAMSNPFDIETLPSGCINLGAAENELMFEDLRAKCLLHARDIMDLESNDIRYNDFSGTLKLRQETASFLNHFLNVPKTCKVEESQLSFHNGCGSAVESLFHVLCDEGDYVLIPSPYYGGFDMDIERRARGKLFPINMDTFAGDSSLTMEQLETGYHQALALAETEGKRVTCLLIMNPVNPLGTIYPQDTISAMFAFSVKYKLHLVVDEIYAFSVFKNQDKFKSVLAREDMMKHPMENVHFLWGFSKDFCVNGFRIGVLISRNRQVLEGVKQLGYFTGISTLMQKLIYHFVSDLEWAEEFMRKNKCRLLKAYNYVCQRIDDFNLNHAKKPRHKKEIIRYVRAEAGFFLWMDLSQFLHANNNHDEKVKREKQLFLYLIQEAKVYIAPGYLAFHALNEPGTFRVVFAARQETLSLALDRIFKAITEIKFE